MAVVVVVVSNVADEEAPEPIVGNKTDGIYLSMLSCTGTSILVSVSHLKQTCHEITKSDKRVLPNETTKPLFVDFYYFCEKKENALNFTYEYIR